MKQETNKTAGPEAGGTSGQSVHRSKFRQKSQQEQTAASKFRMEERGEKLERAKDKLAKQKPPKKPGPVRRIGRAAGGAAHGFVHVDGWLSTSKNMVRVFIVLALAVIIMLAPIFSGEYEGVDNIILTSKYGKTKCATAKVAAGILTAILTTALVAAFNLLLALIFYGTEGLDCSILFAPSDYAEGFIPFNITCGTLLKYQILLAFTCTLSVTGITLLISAISKNQIVAFVASMAIFLFPVLLPITEANPLFRLIGLLPLHHVQAVSLLSVEQMSNGMLYAVWAIPTALLFLGIGAVISRRVFAKHQVS